MQQLLQHLRDGRTFLIQAPAPGPRAGSLLLRTSHSLVSAGTERMLVDFGRAGWLGKARQQPEKVRAVLDKVRANGLGETWRAVRAKLDQPIPLGYCQVGKVVDAGGADWIAVGDRAVSNGPHAEVVSVAHGLCARIPDGVSDEAATFTPLAAIALQGINLLAPAAGDKVVVTGLGLIGQLAVRILRARGCEVLGFDPDADRRARAQQHGAITPEGDPVTAALTSTTGRGVAGVIITASTASDALVSQAARSCRPRGKVVLIGVVGLRLNRADFYRNEVSFQVSRSYGRRERGAPDSAQGNFDQVLAWMAAGQLPVVDLITHRFALADAPAAYAALRGREALGIVMSYAGAAPSESDLLGRTVDRAPTGGRGAGPSVGLIGAGNFATRTLLPALAQLHPAPDLATVASAQGVAAIWTAQSFGARRATTDEATVFAEPSIEAVFITTRHDAHAAQAVRALAAGQHVWVEKPLALTLADLEAVAAAQARAGRIVMVGFNRRFAPMAVALRQALSRAPGPSRVEVTVNAGRLDPEHWTLHPLAGGGRIVGEACHFVDLLRYLLAAPLENSQCTRRDADGQDGGAFELRFAGGATGCIDYRTDLPAHVPKELIVVRGPGYEATVENWSRLTSQGLGGLRMGSAWSRAPRKGHAEALAAFLAAVRGGAEPIPREELFEVSKWAIVLQTMKAGDQSSQRA